MRRLGSRLLDPGCKITDEGEQVPSLKIVGGTLTLPHGKAVSARSVLSYLGGLLVFTVSGLGVLRWVLAIVFH